MGRNSGCFKMPVSHFTDLDFVSQKTKAPVLKEDSDESGDEVSCGQPRE